MLGVDRRLSHPGVAPSRPWQENPGPRVECGPGGGGSARLELPRAPARQRSSPAPSPPSQQSARRRRGATRAWVSWRSLRRGVCFLPPTARCARASPRPGTRSPDPAGGARGRVSLRLRPRAWPLGPSAEHDSDQLRRGVAGRVQPGAPAWPAGPASGSSAAGVSLRSGRAVGAPRPRPCGCGLPEPRFPGASLFPRPRNPGLRSGARAFAGGRVRAPRQLLARATSWHAVTLLSTWRPRAARGGANLHRRLARILPARASVCLENSDRSGSSVVYVSGSWARLCHLRVNERENGSRV